MSEGARLFSSISWHSESGGWIYLRRDWKSKTELPPIVVGPGDAPLHVLKQVPPIEFGRHACYCYSPRSMIFLVDPETLGEFELGKDKLFLAGNFNDWQTAVGDKEWRLKREHIDGKLWLTKHVPRAWLANREKEIGPLTFKFVRGDNHWFQVDASAPNRVLDPQGVANYRCHLERTGRHVWQFDLGEDLARHAESLLWQGLKQSESISLPPQGDFRLLDTDLPMGVTREGDATVFRMFAPRASDVTVHLYWDLDEGEPTQLSLSRVGQGAWSVRSDLNWENAYYHYTIAGENQDASSHFEESFKVVDPYAVLMASAQGPGIVRTELPEFVEVDGYRTPSWQDLIVAECHLGDLVQLADVPRDGKPIPGYQEMIHLLKNPESYIRKMGVNALEFQPLQQMDKRRPEEYHWGYMTVNYFAPESSYAFDPAGGSQFEEIRAMVRAAHEQGIAVILDVVYNHVGEPSFLFFIDKAYYFETDPNYQLMNWSGCGNDLRCSAPMVKRLIIDSLVHWMTVFGVDGFRFDLAELIGVDVLKEIEVALKAVKPEVILIAEPWSFRGHIGGQLINTGYASMNDGYRDFIHEYVMAQGNQDGIRYFLKGSRDNFARFPAQTVNYTESHDDRSWIDRITENKESNGFLPQMVDRRRTHLMMAILMSSVGIPMIAAGQDFLRSKQGVNNTYQRGDLNALDYDRWVNYGSSHDYCRSWIAWRCSEQGRLLRLDQTQHDTYFRPYTPEGVSSLAMLYNANDALGGEKVLFAVNPHHHIVLIPVHDLVRQHYIQIADHERFDVYGLETARIRWTSQGLWMPPLSCGLWVSG